MRLMQKRDDDQRRSGWGDRWAPVTVVFGYGLLVIAWTFGNPPFTAPDEPAHYIRALGVGNGELVSPPATYPRGLARPDQLAWLDQNTRLVTVPPELSPTGIGCTSGLPLVTAACQNEVVPPLDTVDMVTPVGVYLPLPYLLPGLASKFARDAVQANYAGRLASALPAMVMIALAAFLTWRPDDRRRIWLVGLSVAVTPMVVFTSSVLSPSGLEIAAGLAFGAAMVRLSFDDEPVTWVWVGIALSGSVLALSRAPAPLWIAALALIPFALRGVRKTLGVLRTAGRVGALALSAIVLAVVASLGWSQIYGPSPTVSLVPVVPSLSHAFGQFSWVSRQQVGIFGLLEHGMPELAYKAWFALLAVLIILAMLVGTRRQRLVLIGAVLVAVATPALLLAAVIRHTGFEVQGRHVLAITIVVPLLAASILRQNWVRLRVVEPRRMAFWFTLVAASVHVIAWLSNARRYAVGADGPIVFFGRSEWSPPLGWPLWLLLVLAGATSIVVVAATPPADRVPSLSNAE